MKKIPFVFALIFSICFIGISTTAAYSYSRNLEYSFSKDEIKQIKDTSNRLYSVMADEVATATITIDKYTYSIDYSKISVTKQKSVRVGESIVFDYEKGTMHLIENPNQRSFAYSLIAFVLTTLICILAFTRKTKAE